MRVLVTRSEDDAADLCDRLRAAGAVPVEVPLVARRFVRGAVAGAIAGIDRVVLTSVAAADAVAADVPALAIPAACVGPATAARARRHGLTVDLVPARASGADLAAALGDQRGRRLLWPRAEDATPGTAAALRATGGELVEVVAYRNVAPDGITDALRRVWPVDAAVLASGSAARRLAAALRDAGLPAPPRIVAIGPTTAAAARDAGLVVNAVAASPTVDALVAALLAGGASGA